MGGVAKAVSSTVGSVKKVVTNPGKANFGDWATAAGVGSVVGPLNTIGAKLALGSKSGGGSSNPAQAGYTDNPAQTLAQTGGAPLLANIAMGADVESTLAGYFGHNDYKSFYENLGDDDKELVDGVKNQLTQIQNNTDLRNHAVENVVKDFPNIAANAAKAQQQAKSDAGQEFDSTTKGYIDQALNGVAAKYAAGGNLSSGAMAAASARAGADMGMNKLSYVSGEGDKAYDRTNAAGMGDWQARYNETNSLRNFQNLMTQGAAGNGFSAVQASLNRTQQTNLTNAGFANQNAMADKAASNASDNALFGSLGGLAGTVIGGMMGGPMGAMAGSQVGGMAGGMGGGSSSYMGWTPAGNPRLNLGH